MPKSKKYENKIPNFYRRNTLDILMFAHVTAMHERNKMSIPKGVDDFFNLYDISDEDYPVGNAVTTYNRIYNNFVYTKISCTKEEFNRRQELIKIIENQKIIIERLTSRNKKLDL
jgi:hypothetical protein